MGLGQAAWAALDDGRLAVLPYFWSERLPRWLSCLPHHIGGFLRSFSERYISVEEITPTTRACGMDANARRQTGPPVNAPSHNPVPDPNAQRRSYGTRASGYLPVPMNISVPTGRGMAGPAVYHDNYQQSAAGFSFGIPHNTMPYHSGYGQVTHNFHAYYSSPMYNVPQVQQTVYDVSQQPLPQRSVTQRTIPTDVAASYLLSEPADTAHVLPAQAASSGASKVDPPDPADRGAAPDDQSSAASTSKMPQASEAPKEQEHSTPTEMAEAHERYQTSMKAIFTNIHDSALALASESLLDVSKWFLPKVTELETKDMAGSGIATLVSEEILNKMGDEIVQLCDGIEKHGLVDYEYGVWEGPIIDTDLEVVLTECLDFYENTDESGDTPLANPSASR
ncbi:hypothetical protein PG999_004531 [Apiospora kogelbergensis]|uniref:Uncharacterized protein n=1 Tax=Apiospora kogelbergensis TaxID=1337665 RepID=A0AAW0QZL2_9PEZI